MRSKSAQDGTQDGPRSPQDGSKIVLDRFFHLLIFRFDFVSFWDRFWCRFGLPNGSPGVRANCAKRPGGLPRRSQDRLGSVLFSSCHLGSFFGRFGVVLGSFLGAPGVVLVLFRRFNSSIQPVNSSTRRFNSSTHQLINSSTHGPSALSYPARRTARCAIKPAQL